MRGMPLMIGAFAFLLLLVMDPQGTLAMIFLAAFVLVIWRLLVKPRLRGMRR